MVNALIDRFHPGDANIIREYIARVGGLVNTHARREVLLW
jgi:hypothetical protein